MPNAYADNPTINLTVGSISMYKSDTGILYPLSPESAVLSNGYFSVAIAKSIGHAYLVNSNGNSPNGDESGTVSIYDINQNDGTLTLSRAESYIYTGYLPKAIAISESHAYVVNGYGNDHNGNESGTVSIYDINQTDGKLTLSSAESYVYTGSQPTAIAISESHAYVVNSQGNSLNSGEGGTVSIYDINQNDGTLTLSSFESYVYTGYYPYAIAISESHAYVVNGYGNDHNGNESGTVSIYDIDPENGTLKLSEAESYIFTGYNPQAIAISESYAYVTNSYSGSNDSNSVVGTISMYSINQNGVLSNLSPSTKSSTGYYSTAIALNGDYAYVTNTLGESNVFAKSVGTVSIYNINSGLLTLSPVESYVYTQYFPSY